MADETNERCTHAAPATSGNDAEPLNEAPAGSMTASVDVAASHVVLQSAFCGSLRSKKFFMLDGLATEAGDYLDASNHCWCRETYLVVGPDGGRVRPERCVPGRSCYSSALGGE